MHQECQDWIVREVVPRCSGRALDVGSHRHGDQWDPRAAFEKSGVRYVGADMFPGDNVDVVCDIHALPFADATFDACVSFNTLEHDSDATKTVAEMVRVTKPGGPIFISAAGPGYAPHNVDECGGHYANIEPTFFGGMFVVSLFDRGGPHDVRAVRL